MARPKKNPDVNDTEAQAVKPARATRAKAAKPGKTTKATVKPKTTTKPRAKVAAAKTVKPKTEAKAKAKATVAKRPAKAAKTMTAKSAKTTAAAKPAAKKAAAKKTAATDAKEMKASKAAKTPKARKTTKTAKTPKTAKAASVDQAAELEAAVQPAPKRRGRPPKQKTEEAAVPKVPQKPGLVSMAPATKVRPTRSTVKRSEPKVARFQQEQILAEELNQKVLNSAAGPATAKERAAARKAAIQARKAAADTASVKKRQAISVPPAAVTARRRRKLVFAAIAFVVLATCSAGGYMYKTGRPVEAAQTAEARLVQQVGKRVVLPSDEIPSISTVVDAKQVNQPFLEGAKNGDKVLLYFQAGKAIVYRPSTGQIVNIGPLQEPEPRVFIRQGSPSANISKISSTIAASGSFSVDSQDVSPVDNYSKTIVVDVAGNRPDVAKKLASLLGATVAPLPQGETLPDADLLVIVGSDAQ